MANISDTKIELYGERVKEALKEFKKNIETNGWLDPIPPSNSIADRAAYSSMQIEDIQEDDDSVIIVGAGRWSSPDGYFKDLAKKYSLSGEYIDMESGCNFCHVVEFQDGEVIREEEDSYLSDLSVEKYGIESFVCEYDYIPGSDEDWEETYKEELDFFSKHGYTVEDLKKAWGYEEEVA